MRQIKFVVPLFVTYGDEKLVITKTLESMYVWWIGELVTQLSNETQAINLWPNTGIGDKFVTSADAWWIDDLVVPVSTETQAINLLPSKDMSRKFVAQYVSNVNEEGNSINIRHRLDLSKKFILTLTNNNRDMPLFSMVIDWVRN